MRVLVVEDGFEYSETVGRFLSQYTWVRAGSGPEAIERLQREAFDAIFLDMRFDRTPPDQLLGDPVAVADRFNGDPGKARRFLEDHQGNYILAELRGRGHHLPVLMSYDFTAEPKRWERLCRRYAPLDYLPDNASPTDVARRLEALVQS